MDVPQSEIIGGTKVERRKLKTPLLGRFNPLRRELYESILLWSREAHLILYWYRLRPKARLGEQAVKDVAPGRW